MRKESNVRFHDHQHRLFASAAKVRYPPILWKNNVLQAQKVTFQKKRKRLSY
jgi:hypothetical protein